MTDLEIKTSRVAQLRDSARGWHGVQLAVIGFIGLCGVLHGSRADNPMWLQVLAGLLVLVALLLACLATFLVARVAWPLYGARAAPVDDDPVVLERDGRRIKLGLVLTFAAVAVVALATATAWWPQDEAAGGGALAAVELSNGQRLCGALGDAGSGSISVSGVVVALDNVTAVTPVDSCR